MDNKLWHYLTEEVSDQVVDLIEEDSPPAKKQNTALTITSGFPRFDWLETMLLLEFIQHRKR